MTKSIIAAIPAEQRATINAELDALGYGPDTFSVAMDGDVVLQPDMVTGLFPSEPTHYACHWIADDATAETVYALQETVLSDAVCNVVECSQSLADEVGRTLGVILTVTHERFSTEPARWGWKARIRRRGDVPFRANNKSLQFHSDNERLILLASVPFVVDPQNENRWDADFNAMLGAKTRVFWQVVRTATGKVLNRGRLRVDDARCVDYMQFSKQQRGEPAEE